MSNGEAHEIVIIKRVSGGHEDEHHGGVWKIAFADFMTAMMAFFLVMWLISANDKTKATIARYFNPVQLVDSTPQPRGLEDMKPGAPSVMPRSDTFGPDMKGKENKKPAAETPNRPKEPDAEPGKKDSESEGELFRDPYAVLANIAAKEKTPPAIPKAPTQGKLGGSGAIGTKGGEAYRDPFEPAAEIGTTTDDATSDAGAPQGTASAGTAAAEQTPPIKPAPAAPVADARPVVPPASVPAETQPTANLRAAVQALAKAAGPTPDREPGIEVHQTDEGLLVDVTDGTDFSMFGNASARPSPKAVVLMEKVGQLLKTQPGQIVLRGFTDSRPFKSDTYDNWRLSTARADMAHYMLARGGIDERRFELIEGYADRRPKIPGNPTAAANRRIQILVRNVKP